MEQTAVEWLIERLMNNQVDNKMLEQAKEMEKQQIIDARQDGYECTYAEYGETPKCYLDGSNEQYYNETFKQQEQ
jgi:hypothetical protein